MKRGALDVERLAGMLASLPNLSREGLLDHWRQLYDAAPPVRISRQLLMRAIGYKIQEQALGGLKPATRRLLETVLQNISTEKQVASPTVKPGTRLIQEWHGRMHEVKVLEKSVLFEGRQYRSLSQVAHAITGVKWSGPLFFGLKAEARNRKSKTWKDSV